MMDFDITPAHPDGIKVVVEFWAETLDDAAALMKRIDTIEEA